MRLFFTKGLEKTNLNAMIKASITSEMGVKFISFNNRKHKFMSVNQDHISQTLILHVLFNSGKIRITNQSWSNLAETAYPKNLNADHIHFIDCPLLNHVHYYFEQFDPKNEYSLRIALSRIAKKSAAVLKTQTSLIKLSRKGLEKGMKYPYPTSAETPELYSLLANNQPLVNWHNAKIKSFYHYLFEELNLVNTEITKKQIEDLIRLLIEVIIEKKCMNFTSNLNN